MTSRYAAITATNQGCLSSAKHHNGRNIKCNKALSKKQRDVQTNKQALSFNDDTQEGLLSLTA